jgi:subtilase family serine protease
MSDISGATREEGSALLVLPASGGSTSTTIGIPLPLGFLTTGVSDHITVVGDPYNEIPDINRANNLVTVLVVC